jgi:peroxiredoxin
MKNKMIVWLVLAFVLSLLLAACSGTTLTPQTEEPKSVENVVTEEPNVESVATEEPTTESVPAEEQTENVAAEQPRVTGLPLGEIAPDFTLSTGDGNMVNLSETLQDIEQVVLVFYIGVACTPCMTQLSQIENDLAKYEEKGAQVIAVAVQDEQKAGMSAKVSNATFPLLADIDSAIAEAYGVFLLTSPIIDVGVSIPSVFIINKDRQIVWSEITHIEGRGCGMERIPSQTILENLG